MATEAAGRAQQDGSESESQGSSYRGSDSSYSDELECEPDWLEEVQKNGELFYLELSEDEEDALLGHASISQGEELSSHKPEARLKEKLGRILRRKARQKAPPPPQRRSGSALKQRACGVGAEPRRLKEVSVYLNPRRPCAVGGGLLLTLLGVSHRPGADEGRLVVDALVPHGPASKSAQILIGDVLLAVDDVDVTAENIQRVLSCVPGPTQVRLTVESVCGAAGPVAVVSPVVSDLVRLLWRDDAVELMSSCHTPHAALYLSLSLDSEGAGDEEILYQYPAAEAGLRALRGVFLTLSDLLENVTGGRIVSSSLFRKHQLVHVGYWKEGSNLLVICLPENRVPLMLLQTVMERVIHALNLMFGSLDRAFCVVENRGAVDHFFSLLFHQLLDFCSWTSDVSETLLFPGLNWLRLPSHVKVEVDTVLSDFESSDFGEMAEDVYGMRRLYVILGSCVFYKDYLLANHLQREELQDVCVYVRHFCLLPLLSRERVSQLLVWREVFPQKTRPPSPSARPLRRFLLIVALRSFMQCVLLEAGGCASEGAESPGPDCVYVDQVKAALLQLESLDAAIQEQLLDPPTACLSCADWFFNSSGRCQQNCGTSPVFNCLTAASKPPSAGVIRRASSVRRESLATGGSHSCIDLLKKPKVLSVSPAKIWTETSHALQLSSGVENTLFHYVLMEELQGVVISPTDTELQRVTGPAHTELLHNFHRCCISIRHSLLQGGAGLGRVREQGVLFHCGADNGAEQKKAGPVLSYWVVGRLVLDPAPQELYVCFHDSVPEVAVEMAFRLSFGLAV